MQATVTDIRAALHANTAQLRRRRLGDRLFAGLVYVAAGVGVVILLTILGYVVRNGLPALNLAFFTENIKPFGEEGGGVAHALVGSLLMLLVASLIGVTVGIGTAVYLSEFGYTRFATYVRFAVELIAGLPSIVVGAFVWAFFVRTILGHFSGLAGAIALAIIMVPVVARTVEEVLRLVPDSLREAALALGVPRWRMVLSIVIPAARAGIVTGTVLAAARAGGETAPLLLTALGNDFFNLDLSQPMAALPTTIYNYAKSPYPDWHTKAWGASLILIAVIGLFSLLTRWVARRSAPPAR